MTKTSSRATVTHLPLGSDLSSTAVAEKPEDGTVLLGELIYKLDQMNTGVILGLQRIKHFLDSGLAFQAYRYQPHQYQPQDLSI